MRYGMMLDVSAPLPDVVRQVREIADGGFDLAVCTQVTGYYDAPTVLALAGYEVPGIELVTGVVPAKPHHPIALATQALTVSAATGGRFTLGVGLSHKFVVEGVFGLSYDRPASYMREYVEVLVSLMNREQVKYEGDHFQVATREPLDVAASAPPVLLAALGSRMLGVAGAVADGTVTWMTGPATVADHIVPTMTAAAAAAGRPAPRVHVILPICVTADRDTAYAEATSAFAMYDRIPSYRAMLDREGAATPADVAIIGDEEAVLRGIRRVEDAGATELTVVPLGSAADRRRTFELVAAQTRVPA